MTRVIVHAGFHKTGTSSLQTWLGENRRALRPWFDFYGQGDALHRSAVAARIYAKTPFPWRLDDFREAFRADLAALPASGTVVLSREHYSGVMPGHRRWDEKTIRRFRPAAIPLGKVILAETRRRFGPETRVEFLYTTREDEAWAASLYGHLLRSIHLTEDYESFRARLPRRIDLAGEAESIAEKVQPDALHIRALEEADLRIGPAGFVLDLTGVPEDIRATMPPARQVNLGDAEPLREEFLALNRSDRSREALVKIKAKLREGK